MLRLKNVSKPKKRSAIYKQQVQIEIYSYFLFVDWIKSVDAQYGWVWGLRARKQFLSNDLRIWFCAFGSGKNKILSIQLIVLAVPESKKQKLISIRKKI